MLASSEWVIKITAQKGSVVGDHEIEYSQKSISQYFNFIKILP